MLRHVQVEGPRPGGCQVQRVRGVTGSQLGRVPIATAGQGRSESRLPNRPSLLPFKKGDFAPPLLALGTRPMSLVEGDTTR